jgi:hypothetical protein
MLMLVILQKNNQENSIGQEITGRTLIHHCAWQSVGPCRHDEGWG